MDKKQKLTINLGLMELAKIDLLVDNLFYTNRTEFIRDAVKEKLQRSESELEQAYKINEVKSQNENIKHHIGIGYFRFTKDMLDEVLNEGKMLYLFVVGMLKVDPQIKLDDLKRCLKFVKVYGGISSTHDKNIKEYIEYKQENPDVDDDVVKFSDNINVKN